MFWIGLLIAILVGALLQQVLNNRRLKQTLRDLEQWRKSQEHDTRN